MKKKARRQMGSLVLLGAAILVWAFVATCGGDGDGGGGGETSGNNAISGRVFNNNIGAVGNAVVLIEQRDITDNTIDRVIMQTLTDADGNFTASPLSSGTSYDVVIGGETGGKIYVPTIALGVFANTALGDIPLYEATGSAQISGKVTAQITSGQRVDMDIWALEYINTNLRMTVPVLTGSSPTPVTILNVPVDYSLSVPIGAPWMRQMGLGFEGSENIVSYVPSGSGNYFINAQPRQTCDDESKLTSVLSVSPGNNVIQGQDFEFRDCSGY